MRPSTVRSLLSVGLLIVALGAFAIVRLATAEPGPSDRAAVVVTDGCGLASGGEASGVAVGADLVVTAAHVVARADGVSVTVSGSTYDADVVAWDPARDLALLAAAGLVADPVRLGGLGTGDEGELVGGASSGTVSFETLQVVDLSIEEVLGSQLHARRGYQLGVAADQGDSGAGVYADDGRLAGVLFATEDDRDVGWATASSEVQVLLAATRQKFSCDPELSRLAAD